MVSASLSKMQRIVNHQQAHGLVNYCLVDGTLEMHAGTLPPVKLDRGSTAQPKPEYRPPPVHEKTGSPKGWYLSKASTFGLPFCICSVFLLAG